MDGGRRRYHPRRRRAGLVSHYPRRRRAGFGGDLDRDGAGRSLPCLGGAFDLATQIAEVVWINAQREDFIDHGKEVRERADCAQSRSVSGTNQPPCRRQDQGIFNRCQWHPALMQLRRQETIWTAHRPGRPRRLPVSVEDLPDVLVLVGGILLHGFPFSPAARAATARRLAPCGSSAASGSAAPPPWADCPGSSATRHIPSSL